ncbi:MAG: type I DNA topoisomerase [Planctomycetes bacterium]|nr:type I DNA topoisomerase [Planctomycetota bacterium]
MPARKKQSADAPASPAKGGRKKTTTTNGADKPARKTTRKPKVAALPDGGATRSGQKLVIVESPAKAKTINKYLGPGFKVLASMGHVRDLPKRKKAGQLVAGVGKDWIATYEVIDDRRRHTLAELGKEAARSGTVYLATDPDREGEAIAWHLSEVLKLDDHYTFRITFNEITRTAVQSALSHAGKIDMDRVRAQEARRILDRVVGFPLSGLLNKKVKPRSSAGRVQSVALKLVVDREREIEAFKPQEFWKITALLAPQGKVSFTYKPFSVVPGKPKREEEAATGEASGASHGPGNSDRGHDWPRSPEQVPEGAFFAELAEWGGKKFAVGVEAASSEASVRAIATLLDRASYQVTKVEQKDRQEKAPPPFTTSTLQQQANLRLRFSADRTMKTAQKLYEGVPLGSEGSVALITYMRTDSTRVSNEALQAVRNHIQSVFGQPYLPGQPNVFASGKSAQEAHEAIRPTDLSYSPERVAQFGLHGDPLRLYTLIYHRFVASQMAPAVFAVTNVEVTATPTRSVSEGTAPQAPSASAGTFPVGLFKAQGKILKFDGFRRVLAPATKQEDALLPPLAVQQLLDRLDLIASQHFTQPPPRYNEASLVKALEKEGIGRPSTYATIINKITDLERGYIEVKERRFYATEIGKRVVDLLVQFFPKLMDLKFTSHMEEDLDDIENRKMTYTAALDEFWAPFSEELQKAEKEMPSQRNVETGEACPKCGRPLVIKYNKKGIQFVGCSGYKKDDPESCDYIKPGEGEQERQKPVETEHKCPVCGKTMMQFSGRAGTFLRCSGYPECQTKMNFDASGKPVVSVRQTQHVCDKCGAPMVLREGRSGPFLGCTGYPKCKNTKEVDAQGNPVKPIDVGIRCAKCNSPMVIKKSARGPFLGCSAFPKCRSTKPLTADLKEKFKNQLPAAPEKKKLPEVTITETCPECGGPMKLRERRFRGGGYFLGCAKYPKCKGTREASAELLEQLQGNGEL